MAFALGERLLRPLQVHLMKVLATPLGVPHDERAEAREEQAEDGQQERTEMHKARHGMFATEEQVVTSVEHVVTTNGDEA